MITRDTHNASILHRLVEVSTNRRSIVLLLIRCQQYSGTNRSAESIGTAELLTATPPAIEAQADTTRNEAASAAPSRRVHL